MGYSTGGNRVDWSGQSSKSDRLGNCSERRGEGIRYQQAKGQAESRGVTSRTGTDEVERWWTCIKPPRGLYFPQPLAPSLDTLSLNSPPPSQTQESLLRLQNSQQSFTMRFTQVQYIPSPLTLIHPSSNHFIPASPPPPHPPRSRHPHHRPIPPQRPNRHRRNLRRTTLRRHPPPRRHRLHQRNPPHP